jgi:hypothetical protein
MAHFASLFSLDAASKSLSPDSRNSAAPCLASLFKSAERVAVAHSLFAVEFMETMVSFFCPKGIVKCSQTF